MESLDLLASIGDKIALGFTAIATIMTIVTTFTASRSFSKDKAKIENLHNEYLKQKNINYYSVGSASGRATVKKNNKDSDKSISDKSTKTTEIVGDETNDMLNLYHQQGLSQSRFSFYFSLVFAAFGFMVIISSILFIDKSSSFFEQGKAFISLVSGIIIDSVSALFFVQSNKSRELMVEFFEKLRADQKIEESLTLAKEIDNSLIRDRLKTILSLNFASTANIKELLPFVLINEHTDIHETENNSFGKEINTPIENNIKVKENES